MHGTIPTAELIKARCGRQRAPIKLAHLAQLEAKYPHHPRGVASPTVR
jgi:hypothetical protein